MRGKLAAFGQNMFCEAKMMGCKELVKVSGGRSRMRCCRVRTGVRGPAPSALSPGQLVTCPNGMILFWHLWNQVRLCCLVFPYHFLLRWVILCVPSLQGSNVLPSLLLVRGKLDGFCLNASRMGENTLCWVRGRHLGYMNKYNLFWMKMMAFV